jgi:ectoine hydroxylase
MPINQETIDQFNQDGYIFRRKLFDDEEVKLLLKAARDTQAIQENAANIEDADGKISKLTLWNHPNDDIFGMVGRCHRVVDTSEALLGDEVYHYHSKLSMKEPKVGGAWEWHQDYGYWYQNGCLFPDMLSCMIALDAATIENGCMQVLKGSNRLGRIEHGFIGDQTGADMERVDEAKKVLELVYAEMEPGDALFFHGNTLHCSAANESEYPRWMLIGCYNTKHNNPYKEHHHPNYTKLNKVKDSAIKDYSPHGVDSSTDYINTHEDDTTKAGKE